MRVPRGRGIASAATGSRFRRTAGPEALRDPVLNLACLRDRDRHPRIGRIGTLAERIAGGVKVGLVKLGQLPLLLLAAGAWLLPLCARAATEPKRHPNIVLVVIDDLGWADLGCYGSRFHETPNIDRLREQGMKFTQAYANAPNCAPTRASLFTGQYPPRHGVTQVGAEPRGRAEDRKLEEPVTKTVIEPEEVTPAELLKRLPGDAAYATAHIGKWHLGTGPRGPEAQGFDLNVGGGMAGSPPGYFAPYRRPLPGVGSGEPGEYLTDRLTTEAVKFMEANRERPFFLYLPHYGVHTPLQGKQELVAKYRSKPAGGEQSNAVYAAMLESVDASVGRVMETLERLNLARETLLIVTSDNGGFVGATSNKPLRGFKGMLYEGGIRVPLLVRWPARVRAGSTCDTPVITLDLYPTLLEAARAKRDPKQLLDGKSLLPLFTGKATGLKRNTLYWHFPHYLQGGARIEGLWRTTPAGAVRRGDLKLVEYFEDGRLELYDLSRDPGETRNLTSERPKDARRLHDLLVRWRKEVGAQMPIPVSSENSAPVPPQPAGS